MGGAFTSPGNRVARFNPLTNVWTPMGPGMSGSGLPPPYYQTDRVVNAMALLPDGALVAVGGFSTAGGGLASNIARYSFSSGLWSPMSDLSYFGNAAVTTPSGDLFVGGGFETVGGMAAPFLASYTTRPTCPADFNCSSTLEVPDIFDFLTAWFGGAGAADFNGGGLSVQDIFDFLAAWFTGC